MHFPLKKLTAAILATTPFLLAGCTDDGDDGAAGRDGADGTPGINTLVNQTILEAGSSQCFSGGLLITSGPDSNTNGELDAGEIETTNALCNTTQLNNAKHFNRIATFPVCQQIDLACDTNTETVAEIVAASTDGMTLIYTDSPGDQIGFVDITNPQEPQPAGTVALAGEPTSVTVAGDYALVGVNTSADFVNVSGELAVVDIASQTIVTTIDLGGQPDAVAVSPDGAYAAIAIENERDEDLGDGAPPQAPAGYLVIVELNGQPANWTSSQVALTGLADSYPNDPEPEFVDINSDNLAVVTLQENNHLVVVDLTDGSVVNHFSAGTVNLDQVDATEEDPALIAQTESLTAVPREPDGVSWINNHYFATADEGDLDGGSRGFTVFNIAGEVVYSSGNDLDHMTARFGHYPDHRSGNKGNEPENIEMGIFGENRYLFVNSERSSVTFVYDVADPTQPMFKQVLPAALGPEGGLAIPERNLLVVASEEDSRDDKFRAGLNLYRYSTAPASYPTIIAGDRWDGTPIPWAAMSGLAADPVYSHVVYGIEDSAFQQSRIFVMDVSQQPARLTREIRIVDTNDVLAATPVTALADDTVDEDDPTRIDVFDEADLALMINDDKTVNLDPEGIARASDGGFWVASEGSGTVGDASRPVNSANLIVKTDINGVIETVYQLPSSLNDVQLRFGFEGVAEYNNALYVAFQRVWPGDSAVRIGKLDLNTETWEFFNYSLDAPASNNGGWVGLSDLTALGNGEFLVIERDNQAGPDAAVKKLYTFDVTGLNDGDPVVKTLALDLLPVMVETGGLIPEKIEGSALLANGEVLIVNDNDGVDDNSGETQLLNLGRILD